MRSGCYPYSADTRHCGGHCRAVDENGNACVLEPHDGTVHVWATPPCDPKAAVKFARSPASGPTRTTNGDPNVIDDVETGHRWRWSTAYASWEDLGPTPGPV